jgi:hypothetical protein
LAPHKMSAISHYFREDSHSLADRCDG